MSTETVASMMGASPEHAPWLERACIKYGIQSTVEKAHFLGQIHHESAGFKNALENMNYSTTALISKFGRHRITVEQAERYGRRTGQSANQEMIANILYGGEWGAENLGNTEPGDGWRFRGRGDKQLTGRANVTAYSRAAYGDGRVIQDPTMLERWPDQTLSAGWFWQWKNCGAVVPLGVRAVTLRINGGLNGLADREQQTERALRFFKEIAR